MIQLKLFLRNFSAKVKIIFMPDMRNSNIKEINPQLKTKE
jgi:hypothetical protein